MWYLAVMLGVLAAAVRTGNNLLYAILACLLALLVVANILAEINLRGVRVRRELPREAFAGMPAAGWFVLENRRRARAWTVRIEELSVDDAVLATGVALVVPAGGEVRVPVRWRFSHRGRVELDSLRLSSSFPFTILLRSRRVSLRSSLVVFPRPAHGGLLQRAESGGHTRDDPTRRGGVGEIQGFREYVPGDSIRDIHWVTTARTGKPMVRVGSPQVSKQVVVKVDAPPGPALERALQEAAGEVVRHISWGNAVGLSVEGELFPPQQGDGWRLTLLTRLALVGGA